MDFFKNLGSKSPAHLAKVAGVAVVGVIAVVFVLSLLASSLQSFRDEFAFLPSGATAPMPGMPPSLDGDALYPESAGRQVGGNTGIYYPYPPYGGGSTGSDAEEFEVTDYAATVETHNRADACGAILDLKSRDYVIFENAHEGDTTCSYTFKVEHERVEEVLDAVKDLNPKELVESTYTIKNQVQDFAPEKEILETKLDSIDATMTQALRAYDEITALAVRTQDAETLARIVESKLQIIERLTQERLNISAQIDRLARAEAQATDGLTYSRFSVSIYENRYFDGEAIRDSWKAALQRFVEAVNTALQASTVGLVGFLILLVPWALYLVILLVIAKYGWRLVRDLWRR